MSNPAWFNERDSEGAAADAPAGRDSNAPGWATDRASQAGNNNSGGASGEKGPQPKYKCFAQYTFHIINMGLCFFVAGTGALALKFATDSARIPLTLPLIGAVLCNPNNLVECSTKEDDIGNSFVGIYMVLFALILFVFELAQLFGVGSLDKMMKKNFGFLYGINGKASYIIFMAILVFGLTQPKDMATACGITTGSWAPIMIIYALKFPDHFDKHIKYDPASDD
jgi:hypothetical protein